MDDIYKDKDRQERGHDTVRHSNGDSTDESQATALVATDRTVHVIVPPGERSPFLHSQTLIDSKPNQEQQVFEKLPITLARIDATQPIETEFEAKDGVTIVEGIGKEWQANIAENYSEAAVATCPLNASLIRSSDRFPVDSEKHGGQAQVQSSSQDQNASIESEAQDDGVLQPEQSFEALPAKAVGYLESLTASFAPDTKAIWAQIFGPRYGEDKEEEVSVAQDDHSSSHSNKVAITLNNSLQAKRARERKLDEQIQASHQRYRERSLRAAAAKEAAARPRGISRNRSLKQASSTCFFNQSGLSLTQLQSCTKKALDETCQLFRHLHATALEEEETCIKAASLQGIYITQRELEHLLGALFHAQDAKPLTGRQILAYPLDFEGREDLEGVTIQVQLQASWFLPFGQLSQLRRLIMKITKRHLNEEKLVLVDRNLQKQLTLVPFSAKMETLIVQVLKAQSTTTEWAKGTTSSLELVHDLLESVAVKEAASWSDDCTNFELLSPVELVAKTKLSSVVCIQRLVFFRYLIDILTTERTQLSTKSFEPRVPEPPIQPRVKRTSVAGKRKNVRKKSFALKGYTSRDKESALNQAACKALVKNIEGGRLDVSPAAKEQMEPQEETGDEGANRASLLQQELETAMATLRQRLPAIDLLADQNAAIDPAIRATYLAAKACHDSVRVMLENDLDVDVAMSENLQHFLEALQHIQHSQAHANTEKTARSAPLDHEPSPSRSSRSLEYYPPPYPESRESEEVDSKSEGSTEQSPHSILDTIASPFFFKVPNNEKTDFFSDFRLKESTAEHPDARVESSWKDVESPPHYTQEETANGDTNGMIETAMNQALQLQHRVFMNDLVHQVVSNQDESSVYEPTSPINVKTEPDWTTCEVSPGIDRLLHRQRRAPSSTARPFSASTRPLKRSVHKTRAARVLPPRQLNDDQHLAWAARINELYTPVFE